MIVGGDTETYKGFAILITKPDSFFEPKNWQECIEYVARDRENIFYNMDYDFQAMLKYLPIRVRNMLALINDCTFYIRDVEYRVRYVRHKFAHVWIEGRLTTTFYDMAQFYNCPLAVAAKKLGLPPKEEIPEAWYKNMKARLADPKTRETVLSYALQDARLVQQIADKTVEAFKQAGIKFEKPFSNASFSQRVFEKSLTRTGVKSDVDRTAHKAYFGGRIECLKIGYFAEAYYYDVHSAYPSIIANLIKPDGRWVRNEKYVRGDAVYAFVDATLKIPETTLSCPVAVRLRSNRIVYPAGKFRRVFTLAEFRYCEKQGYVEKIHKVLQHIWSKGNYPFKKVRELYIQRQEHPEQSYAVKTILNALYGKTAQMLKALEPSDVADHNTEWIGGQAFKKKFRSKRHTNFVYASEITSRMRTKLIEDMPAGEVIFYATDGVMTVKPVSGLNTGDGLGQWGEAERVTDLIVIGSGVYQYTDSEGKRVTKFRGFSPRRFDLKSLLEKGGSKRSIGVSVIRNTSIRQAISRPHDFNVLKTIRRNLDLNFDTKRAWPKRRTARDLLTTQFDSEPLVYYGTLKLERKL